MLRPMIAERTANTRACMLCGEAQFLCLDCVGYSYHYCAEGECEACVCVKCDGGRSFKAEYESQDLTMWEDLQDTMHFTTVNMLLDGSRFVLLPSTIYDTLQGRRGLWR